MGSSEVLVQMFKCCVAEGDLTSSSSHGRRRIDRSMIGSPTDFRHTGHIGTGDLMTSASTTTGTSSTSSSTTDQLALMQTQMRSKGGYEGAGAGDGTGFRVPHIVNARSLDEAVGRK